MAKRIYTESAKLWFIENKERLGYSSGVSIIFIILLFLSAMGSIEITGYSENIICEGTDYDPCYVYLNLTANEDIFIYPIGYDPWGRDTPFEFDPAIKSWTMARSWGTGWRNYDLTKPCQYTWCGAPPNSVDNKYSLAWREGNDYQIRLEIYKNNATDEIKVMLP